MENLEEKGLETLRKGVKRINKLHTAIEKLGWKMRTLEKLSILNTLPSMNISQIETMEQVNHELRSSIILVQSIAITVDLLEKQVFDIVSLAEDL